MDEKELKHFGVLGMRWGKRKSRPDSRSSDQKQADKIWKKSLGAMTDKEFETATKRFATVNDYKRAMKKTRMKRFEKGETLSNEQINTIMSSPIMQRKLRDYERSRRASREALVKTVLAYSVVAGAFVVSNIIDTRNTPPGMRVISGHWK